MDMNLNVWTTQDTNDTEYNELIKTYISENKWLSETHLLNLSKTKYSSQIKHSGLPVTKGIQYLLVGFLDIDFDLLNK